MDFDKNFRRIAKEIAIYGWVLLLAYGALASALSPGSGLLGFIFCFSAFLIGANVDIDELSLKLLTPRNIIACFAAGFWALYKIGGFLLPEIDRVLAWIMLAGAFYAALVVLTWWGTYLIPVKQIQHDIASYISKYRERK